MRTTTHESESIRPTPSTTINLLLAFELGERTWKLGFTTGLGQRPRIREVPAGAVDRVLEEITRAKRRLHLSDDTPVVSCYEAGRDGFWLHRYLVAQAVTNHVVDSSSIEVQRRARHAKTDKLDLVGLLNLLARYLAGDRRAWRVVRVPTVTEEDARQLHRTWETLQKERTRLLCRLHGLLTTQGVRVRIGADFLAHLATVRVWDGTPLPPGLIARVTQVWEQLALLNAQRDALEAAHHARVVDPTTPSGRYLQRLPTLRGIGALSAGVLATEIFGWRDIQNARQLGSLVGLVPAPYQSGETTHDRGITRAGNKHVRRVIVQLAWSWRRYQPTSVLTQWYERRFAHGSGRLRRIGIVALARKLLIALWRYVDQGDIPEGAVVKG